MKKILLLSALFLAGITTNAQFRYGVKAGYQLSNLSITTPASSVKILLGNKSGFYAGGMVEYNFANNLGIQAEVSYANSGAKITADTNEFPRYFKGEALNPDFYLAVADGKAVITLHQLIVPISIKYNFDRLSVNAGLNTNFVLGFSSEVEAKIEGVNRNLKKEIETNSGYNIDEEAKKQLSTAVFGLHLGAQYAITDNFFAEARYNWGLSSLNKNFTDFASIKQRYFQIGVGYKF